RRHHERAVAHAAALPAARRPAPVPFAGAPALPRRLRFLRPARGLRQRAPGGRAVVGALPGRVARPARAHAGVGRVGAEEEAPPPAQEEAERARHAARLPGAERRVNPPVTAVIALGSNLDDPEAHVRHGFADIAGLPETWVMARSPLYRT